MAAIPPLTPAVRSHLWRLVRYPAFASIAAALVVPLVRTAELRWPAVGLVMSVLEIVVRTIVPTEPAKPAVSGPPAPPAST